MIHWLAICVQAAFAGAQSDVGTFVKSSAPYMDDYFGFAVDVNSSVIAAATPFGVNTLPPTAYSFGAIHVYERLAGNWTQTAVLTWTPPPNPWQASIGYSLAMSGDTIVTGVPEEGSIPPSGAGFVYSGAVLVFERSGGSWALVQELRPIGATNDVYFGARLDLSGDTLVVGGWLFGFDDMWVFQRGPSNWQETQHLTIASSLNGPISIDGDNIAVGGNNSCALFRRVGGYFQQEAVITGANTQASDGFGTSLCVSGDALVVGAPGEDSAAIGVNGNGVDNSSTDSGAAYLFSRSSGVWTQAAYIKASNTEQGDTFGASVALDGGVLVVGAPQEDGGTVGTNGNQLDNSRPNTGAVYQYSLLPSGVLQLAYIKLAFRGFSPTTRSVTS